MDSANEQTDSALSIICTKTWNINIQREGETVTANVITLKNCVGRLLSQRNRVRLMWTSTDKVRKSTAYQTVPQGEMM